MKKIFLIIMTLLIANTALAEDKYSFTLIPAEVVNPTKLLNEAAQIDCPENSPLSEKMKAMVLQVPTTINGQKLDISKLSPNIQVDGKDFLITNISSKEDEFANNRNLRDQDSSKLRFQMNDVKINVSGKKVEFKIPLK